MLSANTGTLFNIQRFSIHDGPGVRTTLFFKGCNLRCFWCHNPESASLKPEIQFFPEKCIACGGCVAVCPEGAQILQGTERVYLRDECTLCFACLDECFTGALFRMGREYSLEEAMTEIRRDREYYTRSGGGVTFSGGEPLLQKDFLISLLKACREEGISTAVDTAGNLPRETFEEVAPLADLFLYDVKAFDEATHRRATGVGNARILANLRWLSEEAGRPIFVRIPVIPGVNDSEEEMSHIAAFIGPLKHIQTVELLPFHTLGAEKYASLGREYTAAGVTPPNKEKLADFQARLQTAGLAARIMD